ncbi:uncharacterized protein LOC127362794 isoform X2 [Dicentrarchus labrax]|uniref:uncharacterized protein LOC127362794 isoform X2 n=1 Tax=Dicentrarchus labrax TaxID=13489 RepID=UPI0021F52608|nr:uncharacterized protein LOC127362794 isoform X2 [Dicentrarchus labrax]
MARILKNCTGKDSALIGTRESWQTPILPFIEETETDESQMRLAEIRQFLEISSGSGCMTPFSESASITQEVAVNNKVGHTLVVKAKPRSAPVQSVDSLISNKVGDTLVVKVKPRSAPVQSVDSPISNKVGDTLVVKTKPPSAPVQSVDSPISNRVGDTLVVKAKPRSAPVQSVDSPISNKVGDTLVVKAKPRCAPIQSVDSLISNKVSHTLVVKPKPSSASIQSVDSPISNKVGDTLVVKVKPHSAPVQSVDSPISNKVGDTLVVKAKPPSAPVQSVESPIIGDAGEALVDTTAHPAHRWNETSCRLMVIALVNKIMKSHKNPDGRLTCDDIGTISRSLVELLWEQIAGSDGSAKPSDHHFRRVAKAVHKDLCKETGDAEILQMCLLSRDASIYRYITETLTQHLVTPQKKTGVNRFFSRLFSTMAKPFTACFGRKK